MAYARDQLRRATRQRVVDAAARLFQERGFAAATIRDVAEASGVSIGTVMSTGDKRSLLVQVFDALIEAEHLQRDGVGSPTVAGAELTCTDRLATLVQPFLALFASQPDLARAYASILVSGNHRSVVFTDLATRLMAEFQRVLISHRCTPAEDASAKAGALYFAYIGTLFAWSARGAVDPNELDASLRVTFAAICGCRKNGR